MQQQADDGSAGSRRVGSVLVTHQLGLHARPAIQFTKTAKRFQADVCISASENGPWVDAKSIARVLALKMRSQQTLHILAEGNDAELAVRDLIDLVANEFKA